jgi:hypothetical protein
MTHKIDFYVNLQKNPIAAQMVARYGEYLEEMPFEARLTFRAALTAYQISKHQWAQSLQPPTNQRLIEQAIESVNSDAWSSEQLVTWIIGFACDEQEQFRIEPMIRALSDSIACELG